MAVRGGMGRAVQHIQIGAAKAVDRRRKLSEEIGLQEVDLQYQLPIEGDAFSTPAFGEVDVDFEWEFHYAPEQRNSDLPVPHVLFGAHIVRGGPVMVSGHVVAWKVDPDTDGVTGAKVSVGVVSDDFRSFAGHLHMNVQGYAQSRDDMSDNPDQEVD